MQVRSCLKEVTRIAPSLIVLPLSGAVDESSKDALRAGPRGSCETDHQGRPVVGRSRHGLEHKDQHSTILRIGKITLVEQCRRPQARGRGQTQWLKRQDTHLLQRVVLEWQ